MVDIDKLPAPELIRNLYSLDSNIAEDRIEEIVSGYKMKIDLFSRWQNGENLKQIAVGFTSKTVN